MRLQGRRGSDAHRESAFGHGVEVVEKLGAAAGERVFFDVGDIDDGGGRGPCRVTSDE